jgi:hypothetical protein
MLTLSYYFLCFLFNKIREQEGGTGTVGSREWGQWGRRGKVAQKMYTHVSKCKKR